MIDKPSILVTSLGRTGTQFFSRLFDHIIPGCDSFHEPDVIQYAGEKNRISPLLSRIKDAGIYNMILLKLLGKWSLIRLSDGRVKREINKREAARNLYRQRAKFIQSKSGNVYIESNVGYYGLLDVLPDVFSYSKTIFIVRDGREWVRSTLNWGEIFGKKGIRRLFAHRWPTAKDFPDSPYYENWHQLSRFEQICWVWSTLNQYALDTIDKNPNARMFHFEKIFSGNNKYTYLDQLIDFAITLPTISPNSIGRADGWLENKIHTSTGIFPAWDNWKKEQKRQFEQICGPAMKKLGYKIE
jgi:hypothetical protein